MALLIERYTLSPVKLISCLYIGKRKLSLGFYNVVLANPTLTVSAFMQIYAVDRLRVFNQYVAFTVEAET
jgi:hypothetical protein